DRLDSASSLNPLGPRPKAVAGSIALRLGRTGLAERYFRGALDRDPHYAYSYLELGALAVNAGRRSEGLRLLAAAVALEPRDEVAPRRGPIVVYPGREATIDALLALRPRLGGGVVLPYPDPDAVRALRDKRGLAELASGCGLPTPATLFEGPAAELATAGIELPALVKPSAAVSALPTARAVASRRELAALAAELPATERVLAQERIAGRLLSLALVLDREGRVAGRFQEEVLRTWPRDAGSFAATVSAPVDRELEERAVALLRGTGYWGLAQLDLVRRDRETLVLDLNPRFYACMPLALRCGVNLP